MKLLNYDKGLVPGAYFIMAAKNKIIKIFINN
jgi:hypothetical protein